MDPAPLPLAPPAGPARPTPPATSAGGPAGARPDGPLDPPPDGPVDPTVPARQPGPDLARAALAAARLASRRGAAAARRGGRGGRGGRADAGRGGYSGAGPDPRDPQPFGVLVRRLLADRDWEATATTAAVLARWDEIVGADVAGHCQPVSLRDGELTLAAESTAWATQLRLLAPRLIERIRAATDPTAVTRVRVHGPTSPSWVRGPRRVVGRGPRDTYG